MQEAVQCMVDKLKVASEAMSQCQTCYGPQGAFWWWVSYYIISLLGMISSGTSHYVISSEVYREVKLGLIQSSWSN